jgi:hypothetical protein
MKYIAVRPAIAVLTFVIGVVTSFWVGSNQPHSRSTKAVALVSARPTTPAADERGMCDQSTPEVKWIFINCEPQAAQGWYGASVVVFYENGDWVHVGDTVRREGDAYVFSTSDGYGAEVGKWKVNNDGSFTVVVEPHGHWRDHRETWLIGDNQAFLTQQAGRRTKIATRFLQIGDSQLKTGTREDGQPPLAIKQLFDPCRIRHDESVAVD